MENYDYLKIKTYRADVLDISEQDVWVLSFQDNYHIKVNTFTKELFTLFNGENSLNEIIKKLKQQGIDTTEQELKELVQEVLIKNNLVEGVEKRKTFRLSLTFHIPIIEARRIYFLLNYLSRMYKKTVVFSLLICCSVIQVFALYNGGIQYYHSYIKNRTDAVSVIVLFFLGTVIHEFGHASAARHYHADVGKMGIGMYLFMPVAYTDLSSIWKLDRKKRVVVNLGGFYFSFVYASMICLIGVLSGHTNLIITNIIILITMVMNANPLLRMDGYWILCDAFGIVNVNRKMYEFFVYIVKRKWKRKEEFSLELEYHHKKIYYLYFFCFLVCNVMTLIVGIVSIIKMINLHIQ